MKFPSYAAAALVAGLTVCAAPAPVASTDVVEYRSANEAHFALVALENNLEKRLTCGVINTVIHAIGTSKNAITYITILTGLARAICVKAGYESCDFVAYIIQAGIQLIYAAAASYSGAEAQILPGRSAEDHLQWWKDVLAAHGALTYDTIAELPFEAVEARDDTPSLVARIQFTGILGNETDRKVDLVANHYSDGQTVLDLPVSQAAANETLAKRADGAGFKISYTTRKQSLLTTDHQRIMSLYLADAWAHLSAEYQMDDCIGFAETDHSANFYYRIIPELYGFGTNYETVDECGGMASYL